MKTLILDTSGSHTTAAVAEDGTLLGQVSERVQPLTHLHDQVRGLLAGLGLRVSDLQRIAVVTGPGSWTGLNIGVTAAKTLAQVLAVPVVELSSLDALAADLSWPAGPVVALLDAKRGNLYRRVYETGDDGRPVLGEGEAEVVGFEEVAAELAAAPGEPLVVEYGTVFRERLAGLGGGVRTLHRESLPAEGLVGSLEAAGARELTGEDALRLAPRYLQKMV
jgi:tRNA threonylcarbamoyladenosine biosynthesis protein TsaB